ncbi:hypothetical protein [Sphingobacterium hungaricum]
MNYLSLSEVINSEQYIIASYPSKNQDNEFLEDRFLFRRSNLSKPDAIEALEEYFCFYKNQTVSNRTYSYRYGRIENRMKLINENIKFSVEVEALYTLTSMIFDDPVYISPVLINKNTGQICNFSREDMDVVYRIYKDWFRRMRKDGFSSISWPLKNSNYMWLGENSVEDIETLISKEM